MFFLFKIITEYEHTQMQDVKQKFKRTLIFNLLQIGRNKKFKKVQKKGRN